jgi:hypothetical protein
VPQSSTSICEKVLWEALPSKFRKGCITGDQVDILQDFSGPLLCTCAVFLSTSDQIPLLVKNTKYLLVVCVCVCWGRCSMDSYWSTGKVT